MSKLFTSGADLGAYLFRITDNGGATADRYTVVFSDGDFLTLSAAPSHPQGVSLWGDVLDVAVLAEEVEAGEAVDLTWGCLPEAIRAHILARCNEGWADFLAAGEAGKPFAVAADRESAQEHEGLHYSGGTGIYRTPEGLRIRREGDASEDPGPFATFREALLYTLPDHYSLAGPEYHSPVINDGPQTDTAYPELLAAAAALEAKVSEAEGC